MLDELIEALDKAFFGDMGIIRIYKCGVIVYARQSSYVYLNLQTSEG